MFENLMLNLRSIGNTILHYSWVPALIAGAFLFLILPSEATIGQEGFIPSTLMVMSFVWIKWAIIGFLIRGFANLFLVKPEGN